MDVGSEGNGTLTVAVDITNTGSVAGKEIVQFYVAPASSSNLVRPPRELKAFVKIYAKPGETVTTQVTLDRVSISYWDDGPHRWVIEPNASFLVIAAKHSRDAGVIAEFKTGEGHHWIN